MALLLEDVADRALKKGRIDPALLEVVGGTGSHRGPVDRVVALTGEQDHGPVEAAASHFFEQLQPRLVAEAVIQDIDVVFAPADRLQSSSS